MANDAIGALMVVSGMLYDGLSTHSEAVPLWMSHPQVASANSEQTVGLLRSAAGYYDDGPIEGEIVVYSGRCNICHHSPDLASPVG